MILIPINDVGQLFGPLFERLGLILDRVIGSPCPSPAAAITASFFLPKDQSTEEEIFLAHHRTKVCHLVVSDSKI